MSDPHPKPTITKIKFYTCSVVIINNMNFYQLHDDMVVTAYQNRSNLGNHNQNILNKDDIFVI